MSFLNFLEKINILCFNIPMEIILIVNTFICIFIGLANKQIKIKSKGQWIVREFKNISLISKYMLLLYAVIFFIWIWLGFNSKNFTTFETLNNTIISNPFIFFIKMLILIFTSIYFLLVLISYEKDKLYSFEYSIIISFISIALLLLISVNDFLTFFLLMELQGLSLFVLCAYLQKKNSAIEAGLKYFIVGAVSTGFLLFGISLIYGATGTILFNDIAILESGYSNMFKLGFIFIFVALFFKLTAAPFHLWGPDVYEGAPTTFIAYLATLPKIVIIALSIRILDLIQMDNEFFIFCINFFIIIGLFTIFFGILGAYWQTKIRPFIFYSSMANIGYILLTIGTTLHTDTWIRLSYSVSIFLFIYAITLFIIFFILCYLYNISTKQHLRYLHELSGLGKSKTGLAIILSIAFFSLMGIPPLAGYFSKFYLIENLVNSEAYFVSLLFLLFSVIGTVYYLRVIKLLFFDKKNTVFLGVITPILSIILVVLTTILLVFWYYTDLLYLIFIFFFM